MKSILTKRGAYCILFITLLVTSPIAQKQQPFRLREAIGNEEYQSMGLHKLTAAEAKKLDQFLSDFADEVALDVRDATRKSVRASCVIETNISGNFEGWDGDTLFKLDNGQIWQQTSYDYTYHYAYRPEVVIYLSSSGKYRMIVAGVDDSITVRRLK